MKVDFIIIGQGICGTLLSYELWKRKKSFIVFDDGVTSSSQTAAGLINPVTGKRLVKSWLYDELLTVALDTYASLENDLGAPLIRSVDILQFHKSPDERQLFMNKAEEESHLEIKIVENWQQFFNYYFGTGSIQPCYIIDTLTLLAKWRKFLLSHGYLAEQKFDWQQCQTTINNVQYNDLKADKVICCDGKASFYNRYFSALPFSLNKGEVVIAHIPELPESYVYKHHYKIIPLNKQKFWIGSSFEWDYNSVAPTPLFHKKISSFLGTFLKMPYVIEDHLAAERPSSIDYKPFVGLHPQMPSVGILNGMGTKGFSQTPLFARQLADHLCYQSPLMPETDINRFRKALLKY